MKQSNAHKLADQEKVLEPLAQALASGFTEASRKTLSSTSVASCIKLEAADLRALLKAGAMTGLKLRFDTGIRGGALLLLDSTDLARIGGLIAGLEFSAGESLGEEVMDACLRYFADAVEKSGESFAKSHGLAIHGSVPELINPDGSCTTLLPLADSYANAVNLIFQISMEGRPDCRFRVLADAELVASLNAQLPGYAATSSVESTPSRGEAPAPIASDAAPTKPPAQWNMDLILDVELEVAVSFGEAQMPLRDVLKLGVGSVIELEKAVNDPVSILVNEKPIARGEVVLVDGNYGVKVLEVESTADRIRSLG